MAADPFTSRTVDDILLGDTGFESDDDPFNDTKPSKNAERDDKAVLSPRKRKAADQDPFGSNNIDEEVKITKQRKKIPKLDAERLLSEPGIPKIRNLLRSGQFQKKLRLKGKGHEYTDTARLLNYYQLWLDSLYPRAKFADAIQLVEKAGHTKKMQMYRKSWIDEGKPGFIRREEIEKAMDNQDAAHLEGQRSAAQPEKAPTESDQTEEEDPSSLFFASEERQNVTGPDGPDDDELDALMAQDHTTVVQPPSRTFVDADSEGGDDLDALLAQESERTRGRQKSNSQAPHQKPTTEQDQDELDAVLNEESRKTPLFAHNTADDFDDEDMDDLDAMLNANASTAEPELPVMHPAARKTAADTEADLTNSEGVPELVNTVSSSPIPNIDVDELDDLLNEHEASLEKKKANTDIVEEYIASSPIPGRESQ